MSNRDAARASPWSLMQMTPEALKAPWMASTLIVDMLELKVEAWRLPSGLRQPSRRGAPGSTL